MQDTRTANRRGRRPHQMIRVIAGLASGMALQAVMSAAHAQVYDLVPPIENEAPERNLPERSLPDQIAPESAAAERGISVRAQIDVLYTPIGGGAPVLVQKAIETRASAHNLSSQYVFDILNTATLAGVDQALAGGARAGRISVVAVCYSYGLDDQGVQSLAPMGVFINTTDLNVLPDGNAALRTSVKVIPPAWR